MYANIILVLLTYKLLDIRFMLKKNLLFLSVIALCAQSYLYPAAGGSTSITGPGRLEHPDPRVALGNPEAGTVIRLTSTIFFQKVLTGEKSNDYSDLLTYLKEQRGSSEKPHALVVVPLPARWGKSRAGADETTVELDASPLRAAVENSRACYIWAACAIAKEFPDFVDKEALRGYCRLNFEFAEIDFDSEGLYEGDRAFLDFFIPHFKNPNFSDSSPFIEAKDPRLIVALHARGLRLDSCVYERSKMALEHHRFSKIQLATFELISRQDKKLEEVLPKLYKHKRSQYERGQRVIEPEPSSDLAENVDLWFEQEREHLRSKGFDLSN